MAMDDRIPSRKAMKAALVVRHGKDLQSKFEKATVVICGLGGLGSNIATALARAGVGKLILIDFDKVDITNLHRQQYKASQIGMLKTDAMKENLKEIAPYVDVITYNEKITEDNCCQLFLEDGVVNEADIICEAFDDAAAKAMLVNFVLASMPEKYLVAASGMAGLGSPNAIHTRKVLKRFYLCGDEVSDAADDIGLVSSRVMLCAAHQAHTVLRILAGQYEVIEV